MDAQRAELDAIHRSNRQLTAAANWTTDRYRTLIGSRNSQLDVSLICAGAEGLGVRGTGTGTGQ